MSGGHYPDREAFSPNGRFRVEARSPDNRPGGSGYASSFRYQLWDQWFGTPRWDRNQSGSEPSPNELVVSDEGFAILQLHSPMWPPRLIAVNPQGHDLIDLAIGPSTDLEDWKGPVWNAQEIDFSTAGNYWTIGSWPYFLTHQEGYYFVCRTRCGQRLILRLSPGPVEVCAEEPQLRDSCEASEVSSVLGFLESQTDRIIKLNSPVHEAENTLRWELERILNRALRILSVYLPPQCVAYLQRLEACEPHGCYTHSSALGYDVHMMLGYRPRIQALLRRFNVEPAGYPAYIFREDGRDIAGEAPPDRTTRLNSLTVLQTAREVLEVVGSPDFVGESFNQETKRWSATWEYDQQNNGQWSTVQLTWDLQNKPATLQSLAVQAIDWNHRELRYDFVE